MCLKYKLKFVTCCEKMYKYPNYKSQILSQNIGMSQDYKVKNKIRINLFEKIYLKKYNYLRR